VSRYGAAWLSSKNIDSFMIPVNENRSTYAPQMVASDLVLHFDAGSRSSYAGAGTTLVDLSGSANHATLVNGVGFTSSNSGGLVFDGVNDYVTTSNLTFTPRSISFWLYNNSTITANDGAIGGPSTYQSMLSFGNTYGVNLGGWTGNATNEAIHIWDTSTSRLTYTNQQVNIGFHNFVFNWNGSNYEIWVDGIKRTSIAGSTGHAQLVNYSNIPIRICGSINNGYYFFGNIYIFSLYSGSLTDSQILLNFNAFRGRFNI